MIAQNITNVKEQMLHSCLKVNRSIDEITLISVSKTKPVTMILEAYHAGIREFGENKVQEILEKAPQLPKDIKWHMIGHLQTNKVKQVLPYVSLIHSVDSIRLAKQIQREAEKLNLIIDILIEVNIAKEESKNGFFVENIEEVISQIKDFSNIRIKGLMTIAPFVADSEENRECFRKLHQLYVDIEHKNIDNVTMSVLSMGMTGDFQVAIEEGASMIRVGTGIFGAR